MEKRSRTRNEVPQRPYVPSEVALRVSVPDPNRPGLGHRAFDCVDFPCCVGTETVGDEQHSKLNPVALIVPNNRVPSERWRPLAKHEIAPKRWSDIGEGLAHVEPLGTCLFVQAPVV